MLAKESLWLLSNLPFSGAAQVMEGFEGHCRDALKWCSAFKWCSAVKCSYAQCSSGQFETVQLSTMRCTGALLS